MQETEKRGVDQTPNFLRGQNPAREKNEDSKLIFADSRGFAMGFHVQEEIRHRFVRIRADSGHFSPSPAEK